MLKALKSTDESFNRDNWQTPQYILDKVNEMWPEGWTDPFPVNWDGQPSDFGAPRIYCNPPFSEYYEMICEWFKEAYYGQECLWIMHHDSSTRRQQLLMKDASAICLLRERVKFINPDIGKPEGTSPGKSQTLIYMGESTGRFSEVFSGLGDVLVVDRFDPYS